MSDFSRTSRLLGKEAMNKLKNTTVTIFGIGGVGSYTVEALARCCIEHFILVDSDIVSESNINRQLIALNSTVGKNKVDVMRNRIKDINPKAKVDTYKIFYLPENNIKEIFNTDYIVDAIDTISAKLDIIKKAKILNIPIISAMGAGNKLNPTLFEVDDIFSTSVCPLCRVMRRELKKLNIDTLKVVYSKEKPIISHSTDRQSEKQPPASISFVPSVMGLVIASEIVKDIIKP